MIVNLDLDITSQEVPVKFPLTRAGSQWSPLAGKVVIDTSLPEDKLRGLMTDPVNTPILMPEFRQRLKFYGIISATMSCLMHNLAFSYVSSLSTKILENSQSSALFSAFSLAMMVSAPLCGYIASLKPENFNLRFVTHFALLMQAVFLILFAFIELMASKESIIIAAVFIRIFQGIASGMGHMATFAIIALLYPKSLGTIFGLVLSLTIGVGLLVGSTIGSQLFIFFDGMKSNSEIYSVALILTSIVVALLCLSSFVFSKKHMIFIPLTLRDMAVTYRDSKNSIKLTILHEIKRLLLTRGVILELALTSASLGILAFFITTLPKHINVLYTRLEFIDVGIVFLIAAVLFVLITPLVGKVVNFLGLQITFCVGIISILASLLILSPGIYELKSVFLSSNSLDGDTSYHKYYIYISLILLGTGVSLIMNPSVPGVLKTAKQSRFGNGAIEIVGGLVSSAIAFGMFIGILIGDVAVASLGYRHAIGINTILFVVILACILTESLVHFIFARIASKREENILKSPKPELKGEIAEQMKSVNSAKEEVEQDAGRKIRSESVASKLPSIKLLNEEQKVMMMEKRKEVFEELIFTEASYVNHLDSFLNSYLAPLKILSERKQSLADKLIGDGKIQINGDEIHKLYNQIQSFYSLHSALYKQLSNVPDRLDGILGIFRKYSAFFRIYAEYVSSYDERVFLLGKLKKHRNFNNLIKRAQLELLAAKQNDKFLEKSKSNLSVEDSEFASSHNEDQDQNDENMDDMSRKEYSIKSEEKSPAAFNEQHQTIESYLIMPIQRIPRYLLLIKEIMKNTSEDEEYTSWSLVFDQVDKICSQINNSSKSREQSMKILKIQDKISGLDDPIVAPHRSFIKEAKAIRIRATTSGIGKFKIKLYLFNDMILWTSRSNKFRGQLDLLGTKILSILPADILRANRAEDVLLFADDSVKSLRGFHILSQNSLSPLTIIFDNCETKMEWESLVSAQIFSSSRTIHAVLKAMRKISISKPMIPIAEIEEPQAEAGAPLVDEEKKEDI